MMVSAEVRNGLTWRGHNKWIRLGKNRKIDIDRNSRGFYMRTLGRKDFVFVYF